MELAGELREVASRTEASRAVEFADIDEIEEHTTWLEERVARHKETRQA